MQLSAPPMSRGIEAQVVAAYPSAPYKEAAPPMGQSCALKLDSGANCLSYVMSGSSWVAF